jgi:putative ABC transport system ATP-binding protein
LNRTDTRSAADPILKIENLSRIVEGKPLVEAVSFEVIAGDILAIVGPSGSGKSSLLRLINRLDEPTSGTVYLEGQDYRQIPPRELRRRVGLVMQSPHLFPGTVAENIRFGPEQRGESVSDETIEHLLDEVALSDYAGRQVNNLSVGEAQRVSLARTLANSPDILMLDEPTSALDQASRQDVEELVCHIIRQQQLTCLVVTHDHAQAARIGRRAMILERGRLKAIGSIEEVLHVSPDHR